jgi:hypothetical protein
MDGNSVVAKADVCSLRRVVAVAVSPTHRLRNLLRPYPARGEARRRVDARPGRAGRRRECAARPFEKSFCRAAEGLFHVEQLFAELGAFLTPVSPTPGFGTFATAACSTSRVVAY